MGLPRTPVSIEFLRSDKTIQRETVARKETGYAPTVEYYPSMKLVKCSNCRQSGVCEFRGGMNLKEGDRLMDGKPIRGECGCCGKMSDLVPLPVDDPRNGQLKLYYDMQRALKREVERGRPLGASGQLMPLARQRPE